MNTVGGYLHTYSVYIACAGYYLRYTKSQTFPTNKLNAITVFIVRKVGPSFKAQNIIQTKKAWIISSNIYSLDICIGSVKQNISA